MTSVLRHIPNAITVVRVLLVIPTAWCLIEEQYVEALVLMAVAGASDAVDGWLARRFDWVSWFGAALDPLADKILVGVLFVTLTVKGVLPLWVAGIAIGRDLVILAGATVYRLLFKHIEFTPTLLSKANTAMQIVVLLVLLLSLCGFEYLSAIAGSRRRSLRILAGVGAGDRLGRRLRDQVGASGVDEVPRRASTRRAAVSEDQKRQLALKFPSERRCTLDNFEVGPNAELIAALGRCGRGGCFRRCGSSASPDRANPTCCRARVTRRPSAGAAAAYLPARLMAGGIEALDGLGDFGVVAIDDLERWVGQRRWEEALLNLYQQLLVRGGTLLVASRNRPLETTVGLADLDSRLRAAQVFVIRPLDDADRARAIERLAAQRGLELGADVVAFILRRAPRRMDELIATFDRLDRGALAQQRRLTIPLAKDVLGL